jgi:hypothetical protein
MLMDLVAHKQHMEISQVILKSCSEIKILIYQMIRFKNKLINIFQ